MKKLISAMVGVGLLLSATLCVSATINTSYSVTADYSSATQGNNGWYYQIRDGGAYSGYYNLTKATEGTQWNEYTASGAIQRFVSGGGSMQAKGTTVDNKTAFVWKAPYSGKVNLTANGNIHMAYNSGQKAPIEAGIAHTNANYELIDYQNEYDTDAVRTNDDYIWWYSMPANDKVGIAPYSIDIEVTRGDMLFFEIGSTSATAATIGWKPVVTYTQAAEYTVSDTAVDAIKNVSESASVAVELYGMPTSTSTYFMVYDNQNRLRDITAVGASDISGSRINKTITMPSFGTGEESYEGWRIDTFAVTADTERFYPISISEKMVLK